MNFYVIVICGGWTHFHIDIWWMDSTFYLLYDTHHRGAPKKEGFIQQQQQQRRSGKIGVSSFRRLKIE